MSLRWAWDFGFIQNHALRKASERATQIEKTIVLTRIGRRGTIMSLFDRLGMDTMRCLVIGTSQILDSDRNTS